MNASDNGLPIEQFIQALTSQLDRVQATMALKARAGLPLTFAIKDMSLELRTHVEMAGSVVRIRPAAPNEAAASTIHLALTTITRPMIEENTIQLASQPDEPSLKEVLGGISEDEQRRLEWAGIHTVSQLREVQRQSGEETIEKFTQLPVSRLRAALMRAAEPRISQITPEHLSNSGTPVLRIRGNNLMRGQAPSVRIGGEPVPVLQSSERELLVTPHPHQLSGTLSVEIEPGLATEADFNLSRQRTVMGGGISAQEGGDGK